MEDLIGRHALAFQGFLESLEVRLFLDFSLLQQTMLQPLDRCFLPDFSKGIHIIGSLFFGVNFELHLLEQLFLFSLEHSDLLFDIWVHEVDNVLSVHDLGLDIVLPVRVLQEEPLLPWQIEYTSSSVLGLQFFDCGAVQRLGFSELGGRSRLVVSLLGRLEDSDPSQEVFLSLDGGVLLDVFIFLLESVLQKEVACRLLHLEDRCFLHVAQLDHSELVLLDKGLQHVLVLLLEVLHLLEVDLSEHQQVRLLGKEVFDTLEQADLLLDCVATALGDINEIEHTGLQVRKSSDTLHLNGVHAVDIMIKDSGGVDDLPLHMVVLCVSHKQRLRGESVGLHFDVGMGDIVDKAGLSDIGEPTEEDSAGEGVNGGQSSQVLPHFLQETETGAKFLESSGHSTESCTFEHLAAIGRLGVLEEFGVVLGDFLDNIFDIVELS